MTISETITIPLRKGSVLGEVQLFEAAPRAADIAAATAATLGSEFVLLQLLILSIVLRLQF